MTGTFTFDFSQPWRPRSQFLQPPQPTPAQTPAARKPPKSQTPPSPHYTEESGVPADWHIVQQKMAATLRNFPDAFEAVRVMLNMHYPEDPNP